MPTTCNSILPLLPLLQLPVFQLLHRTEPLPELHSVE